MTDEVVRDKAGKFVKGGPSPNKAGRPRGTKGAKHRAAKNTLENMVNKFGPEAIKNIMEMGLAAKDNNDIGTAVKCFMYVGDKYYQLTIHNDKVEMQEIKKAEDAEAEKEDNTIELPEISFSFKPTVVNE